MRRTLRNTETSLFLKADGTETEFMELARSFENYEEALSFTRKRNLQNVELVVRSSSAADEFTLRLQQSQLRYLRTSRVAATSLAENYVGVDRV